MPSASGECTSSPGSIRLKLTAASRLDCLLALGRDTASWAKLSVVSLPVTLGNGY